MVYDGVHTDRGKAATAVGCLDGEEFGCGQMHFVFSTQFFCKVKWI